MNATTLHRGWEELLDARINLLKQASKSPQDTLAIIETMDELNEVDYNSTFIMEARRHENVGTIADDIAALEKCALRGAEDTKNSYETVRASMGVFKDTPDGQTKEGWQEYLLETMENERMKVDERWGQLSGDGKEIIRRMPSGGIQEAAARVYGNAMAYIADFDKKTFNWIKSAIATVAEWLKHAKEKIEEWARNIRSWFSIASDAIKLLFRKKLVSAENANNAKPTTIGGFARDQTKAVKEGINSVKQFGDGLSSE